MANENDKYSLLKSDYFIKRVSGKFIINSVISIFFVFASSLIDTLLVGIYLGEEGLSAMSIISPVYLVYYTVGAVIGIGGSILASRSLGKDNIDEYRRVFTVSSAMMLIMAIIMTLGAYVFFNPIINGLCKNVSGGTEKLVRDYLKFYIPGGAATLIAYIPLYFLKTDGRPKYSSVLFSISAVINIVFSWLFMSPVFNMGTAGASLATSISMGVVAIFGFIVMLKGQTELKFVKKAFSRELVKNTVVAGIPNGMNNLLESARILLVNFLILSVAASLLPCYTVVRNVTDILSSVILGISSAIIPLVGVLYGERDFSGTHDVMRNAMKKVVFVTIALVTVASIIPDVLFRIFGVTDMTVIKEGRFAIFLSTVGLIASAANTLYIGYLTAVKKEGIATTLVCLRLFVLLAAFAIPLAFTVGSKGIWASLSLCEIFTLLIYFIIVKILRKKNPNLDGLLINIKKENECDISFSVKNDVSDIVFASEKISEFLDDSGVDMKHSMKVSMAIEEILTFLINHCINKDSENFTDIRVVKINDEIMIRFRYVGEIYDPIAFYKNHKGDEALEEELLGLKMVSRSATLVDFRQTLGANNLLIFF